MNNQEVVLSYMSEGTKDEKQYLTPDLFESLQDAKHKVNEEALEKQLVAQAGMIKNRSEEQEIMRAT